MVLIEFGVMTGLLAMWMMRYGKDAIFMMMVFFALGFLSYQISYLYDFGHEKTISLMDTRIISVDGLCIWMMLWSNFHLGLTFLTHKMKKWQERENRKAGTMVIKADTLLLFSRYGALIYWVGIVITYVVFSFLSDFVSSANTYEWLRLNGMLAMTIFSMGVYQNVIRAEDFVNKQF
jgi:hypothetical protein